ncbi:MFS transporter [Planobispora takensis]|nr:MFS transporter [Planobispora takensis]
MSIRAALARTAGKSPYWPVITHPLLRRVLPGLGVSALGGGMTTVAVSWLALELAPADTRGAWLAATITAHILPGALGGVLFGRFLNGRSGPQLAGWDALLRTAVFAAIPLASALGGLSIGLYIALLGIGSLLTAWGKAGRYTMLAELLPAQHHLAGNSLVNVMLELSTVFGPLLAATVIAHSGPEHVMAIIAVTSASLAATYRFAIPSEAGGQGVKAGASPAAGFRAIYRNRHIVILFALSFGFFFFYGPVTVAIPLYVVDVLHASAATLAGFYTAFGAGAVLGALVAGHLQKWPLIPTTIGIVLGFGLGLIPLGLGVPTVVAWAAFALCGVIWGPFPTVTTTLFQRLAAPEILPRLLAARGSVMGVSVPLGAMLGAPAVHLFGARGTLLVSALGITALGVFAALFLLGRPAPARTPDDLTTTGV